MKIIYLFIFFISLNFIISCKVQKESIDIKYSNVVVYDTYKSYYKPFLQFKKYSYIYIQTFKHPYDLPELNEKVYSLIQNNDTMRFRCQFSFYANYYLKNIKFQKGFYTVLLKKEIESYEGKKIRTNKSVQNLTFKNAVIKNEMNKEYKYSDVLFKNLKFKIIDFSDSTNVKLIPLSKEKFWENI